jgi:hypothetical protein
MMTRIQFEHDQSQGRGLVEWPPVSQILSGAEATYRRLVADNQWNAPKADKKAAFNARTGNQSGPPPKLTCFNCGKEGHTSKECTVPKDKARIQENYKKFKESRQHQARNGHGSRGSRRRPADASQSSDKPPPQRTTRVNAGIHEVLNKKGSWVRDEKFYQAQKAEATTTEIVQLIEKTIQANLAGPDGISAMTPPTIALPPTVATPSTAETGQSSASGPAIHAAVAQRVLNLLNRNKT